VAVKNVLCGDIGDLVVADSFALYRLALGHTEAAQSLMESVRNGDLRVETPAVAFAVACGMRTCWDSDCLQDHRPSSGSALQSFHSREGIEVVYPSSSDSVSAGRHYANCVDRRLDGAEVLAACHARLLAEARNATLISTARASYCYVQPSVELAVQVRLI
jgi:hypothetical protein